MAKLTLGLDPALVVSFCLLGRAPVWASSPPPRHHTPLGWFDRVTRDALPTHVTWQGHEIARANNAARRPSPLSPLLTYPPPPPVFVLASILAPPPSSRSSRCCCLYVRCSPTPTRMIRSYQRSRRCVYCRLFLLFQLLRHEVGNDLSSTCLLLNTMVVYLSRAVCLFIYYRVSAAEE